MLHLRVSNRLQVGGFVLIKSLDNMALSSSWKVRSTCCLQTEQHLRSRAAQTGFIPQGADRLPQLLQRRWKTMASGRVVLYCLPAAEWAWAGVCARQSRKWVWVIMLVTLAVLLIIITWRNALCRSFQHWTELWTQTRINKHLTA